MKITQALADLGVGEQTLGTEQKQALDQDGFFVVEGALSEESCAKMCYRFDQIHQVEGKRAGWQVHKEDGATRLSNLLNKTTEFDDCLYTKPLLAAAYHLLKSDCKIYGFTAIMVQLPVDNYSVLNSLILLDPFTTDNVATRIVPGSHLSGLQAEDVVAIR